MSILMSEVPPVKPYLTIKQHPVNGHWYPVYGDRRGEWMTGSFGVKGVSREAVAEQTRTYAFLKGLGFKEPEPEKPVMHVVCSWCGKSMGTKPCLPEQHGQTTHGICPECYKQKKEELKRDGAPDDLVGSFDDFMEHGVRYARGFDQIEEGVREDSEGRVW